MSLSRIWCGRGGWALLAALGMCIGGCPLGGGGGNGGGDGGGGSDPTPVEPPSCDPTTAAPASTSLQQIAQTGDAVPGQDPAAAFTFFGTPIIDSAGRIAFWAGYDGGAGDAGLFVWDGAQLINVIDDDPADAGTVPGRDPDEYFGNFDLTATGGELPLVWGSDGRLVFVSRIVGDSGQSRGLFRYRATDGNLILITDMEAHAAQYDDALQTGFNCEFLQPMVSDNGIVSYVIEYTYITTSNGFVLNRRALFTSNGTSITRVADANPRQLVNVPDQADAAQFTSIGSPLTINNAGAILYQGEYSTAVTGAGDTGAYVRLGAADARVIDNRTNQQFLGLTSGSVVNPAGDPFPALTVGLDLRIALQAPLELTNATRDTVLYWDTARWRELRAGGRTATRLLSGISDCGQVLVLSNDEPYITGGPVTVRLNDDAPIALLQDNVNWSVAGYALNNQGRALVRYTRGADGAVPGLAFFSGNDFLIVADPSAGRLPEADALLTVEAVELNRVGRSGALNDADQFVFRLTQAGADGEVGTADDVQEIYLGRPG